VKHYRVDMADVKRRTRRDRDSEREEAAEYGFYTYNVFEIVPIKDIVHTEVWRPERYERVTEAIAKNIPLPAIQVDKQGSKYSIADGIHRYNASRDAGMTHIPVVYGVVVEAPELFKPPEAEKPALTAGAWVKLHDPRKWGATSPWARVDEVLGTRMQKGVKRHLYGLVGIVNDEPDFLGDILDSEIEAADPPAQAETIIKRWMTARRVAARFLNAR
jgi:hypothetical protein